MQGKTIVILLVLLAVLLPTWYVAAQGEPPSEEIKIDQSVNEISPLAGFVDTPTKLSPSQVGVIVWVALFGLVGTLAFFHRFMNRAARPDEQGEAAVTETATDGGPASSAERSRSRDGDAVSRDDENSHGEFSNHSADRSSGQSPREDEASGTASEPRSDGGVSLPWIETGDRWLVEYHPSSDAIEGLIAMGGLTALTIAFAALFTGEYLTLARTQYFGVYAFGMFMSLTGLTVSYYAWFMPHIKVAERRGH